jgi:hypothetical protein
LPSHQIAYYSLLPRTGSFLFSFLLQIRPPNLHPRNSVTTAAGTILAGATFAVPLPAAAYNAGQLHLESSLAPAPPLGHLNLNSRSIRENRKSAGQANVSGEEIWRAGSRGVLGRDFKEAERGCDPCQWASFVLAKFGEEERRRSSPGGVVGAARGQHQC